MVICLAATMIDTDIITGEKPLQVVQAENVMLEQFQAVEPELKGQIQPEESVGKIIQVIESLDTETSGSFLSHNGDKATWF